MEFKYFGIVPNEIDPLIHKIEFKKFILDNELLTYSIRLNSPVPNNTEIGRLDSFSELKMENGYYKYSKDLVEDLYTFLLNHYRNGLGKIIMFNGSLVNETFALSESKKRKIALNHFNVIYEKWARGFQNIFTKNEIGELVPQNRFKTLKRVRDSYIEKLRTSDEIVVTFLKGDIDFFNKNLFHSHPLIQEIFNFENDLQILIELNKKFSFTEDLVFVPKTKAQLIYEEYSDEFESLEQLDFIEEFLKTESNTKYSYIVSLYFFFHSADSIRFPKEPFFRKILDNYFHLKLNRIKISDSSNMQDLKRVKNIKKEWDLFTNK